MCVFTLGLTFNFCSVYITYCICHYLLHFFDSCTHSVSHSAMVLNYKQVSKALLSISCITLTESVHTIYNTLKLPCLKIIIPFSTVSEVFQMFLGNLLRSNYA